MPIGWLRRLWRGHLGRTANRRGIAYVGKGEYFRAIQAFTEALRHDPNNAEAWANRGIAYARKGEVDRAIQDYDQAIQISPSLANAYYNRLRGQRRVRPRHSGLRSGHPA